MNNNSFFKNPRFLPTVMLIQTIILGIIIVLFIFRIKQTQSCYNTEVDYLIISIVDNSQSEETTPDLDNILLKGGYGVISLNKKTYSLLTGQELDNSIKENNQLIGHYFNYFGMFGWELKAINHEIYYFSRSNFD